MCFDRANGRSLWQEGAEGKEAEPTHKTNPYCSPSPVADGERVIAWFGSDGLHCFDFEGKLLWSRDLGAQRHIWGYGASPVIYRDLCILNFGPGDRSFLIAVDKKTGKTAWQHDEDTGYSEVNPGQGRDSKTYIGSWSTPVVMRADGKGQLLLGWPNRLAAHDPGNGKVVWTCSGLNPLVYTSAIYAEGIVVAMGGFGGLAMAVRTVLGPLLAGDWNFRARENVESSGPVSTLDPAASGDAPGISARPRSWNGRASWHRYS